MKDSKNVVSNSSINVGGNLHIGDIINLHIDREVSIPKPNFSKENANDIKFLISKGEIEKAIDCLLQYSKGLNDNVFNEVILVARQWEDLQRDVRIGILSTDEKFRLASRITFALLTSVDALQSKNT